MIGCLLRNVLCGLTQYNMLVHMVLIVRLLEIFLAHLVCAAVRGNPHIHARLGIGSDLDALALDSGFDDVHGFPLSFLMWIYSV